MTYYANYHVPKAKTLACEQALCLGKNSDEREGKGGRGEGGGGWGGEREPLDKQLRPLFCPLAIIAPNICH